MWTSTNALMIKIQILLQDYNKLLIFFYKIIICRYLFEPLKKYVRSIAYRKSFLEGFSVFF